MYVAFKPPVSQAHSELAQLFPSLVDPSHISGHCHSSEGYTGITNFQPSELPVFLLALQTYDQRPDRNGLIISLRPMLGMGFGTDCFSLHHHQSKDRGKVSDQLGDFWRVFDSIKKALAEVTK